MGAALRDLVRQREVAFGLPRGRDPGVDRRADHGLVFIAQNGVDLLAQEGAPEGEFAFNRHELVIELPPDAPRRIGALAGGRGGFVSLNRALKCVFARARTSLIFRSRPCVRRGALSDARSTGKRHDRLSAPGLIEIEAGRARFSGSSVDVG